MVGSHLLIVPGNSLSGFLEKHSSILMISLEVVSSSKRCPDNVIRGVLIGCPDLKGVLIREVLSRAVLKCLD